MDAVVTLLVAIISIIPASIAAWAALRHRTESHYVRNGFEAEFKQLRDVVHGHVNDHRSHADWRWLYEHPRGKHAAQVERN